MTESKRPISQAETNGDDNTAFEQQVAALLADGVLQHDVLLSRYMASRMGGPCRYLLQAQPDTDVTNLYHVLDAAWSNGIATRIFGAGANVLVGDGGFDGLVIINRRAWQTVLPYTGTEQATRHRIEQVEVGSGTNLQRLARWCATQGLQGFSWATGVPGTVGGAIVNNAGAHGVSMADSVHTVSVYAHDGGLRTVTRDAMQYQYRESLLKHAADKRFWVDSAVLTLRRAEPDVLRRRISQYNDYRKRTQPGGASLGSIFKNPEGDYAGRLIEASGLKGVTVGQAQVSPVHANFIVNLGAATADEYIRLIQHVRDTVRQQHGVQLELEVEVIGID